MTGAGSIPAALNSHHKPNTMKPKEHRFTVIVRTHGTRDSAELAVLCAFAKRQPDGCKFQLLKKRPKTEKR